MSQYLLDISTSGFYNRLRNKLSQYLDRKNDSATGHNSFITKLNNSLKNLVNHQTNMFEGLNIRYFGPTDATTMSSTSSPSSATSRISEVPRCSTS